MADPTPSLSNNPEKLPGRPLGVRSSLSGLGWQLQRYAPLGVKPLRISQPEALLSDRSATVAEGLESARSPAGVDLIGRVAGISQPQPAAVVDVPITESSDFFDPLSVGDIMPPQPSKTAGSALQRQPSLEVSAPAVETAGALAAPPQSAAAPPLPQAQPLGNVPRSFPETLVAGDIIPPRPSKRSIQRSATGATAAAPAAA
ncbi:MAG: hypothetical protein O2890_12950, partial [Cyanobacteria bacterium]|nr:hypothetical protein [Cyanobacteriota bacterium]